MKKKSLYYWLVAVLLIVGIGGAVYATSGPETTVTAKKPVEQTALTKMSHLGNVVKIYVPSTINVSQPIDNTPYVDKTLTELSNMFGGATAVDGQGAWVSDTNQLVKEKVTIVYAFTDKLDKAAIEKVVNYTKSLKTEMTQSSVSLEVNGKMYFIE
ncbi:hypothetical protein [Risungbinella massiliensis]|uniref:hypothetical protein n=1 Tax=Risungbinella massiliensis TaxID=1329796 RepID=UPI0005CC2EFD|nr:hypothetical protein [Risungbinella massiliensis]